MLQVPNHANSTLSRAVHNMPWIRRLYTNPLIQPLDKRKVLNAVVATLQEVWS